MSDARISCTNQQLVAGGFTVVVGVAVTAMIARLFKERVGTVVAVGVSASLVAGSVVAMSVAPKPEIAPGPGPNTDPVPPPFPTEKGQLRAWINAQEGSLKDALEAVAETDARKAEVIGWMEEVERRGLLKEFDASSPLLKEYFGADHNADLLAWAKAKDVDAVSELGTEAIKVVVKAKRAVNGFSPAQVAKLVGKLGADAPDVAEDVPDEFMRFFEKSAVQAYAGAAGTDVSEYWKDKDLRDYVLEGLFSRDSQADIDYKGMLNPLTDDELRVVFQTDDRLQSPSGEFCDALRGTLVVRQTLTGQVAKEEGDISDLQRFLLLHFPGWFTPKECLGFLGDKTHQGGGRPIQVRYAAAYAVRQGAPFNEILQGLSQQDARQYLSWAMDPNSRASIPQTHRDKLVAAVEEALK